MGDAGVHGGEQQRPRCSRDQCDCRHSDGEQDDHLTVGDAEERPEEERVEAVEHTVVEADEEEAERQGERLQRADRRRLGAQTPA